MKRQDSLRSSSTCRDKAQEKLQAKTIGCMSGIIQFVCKAQSPSKFLTFGKKQTINVTIPSLSPSPEKAQNKKRHYCEIPRSPTLPAEIRRSNSANSLENIPAPPALTARLMGLEESSPMMSSPKANPDVISAHESLTEKRLRLLGALQKCDEDLKALKKILEAVQTVEQQQTPQPPPPCLMTTDHSAGFVSEKIITTVCAKTLLEVKEEEQQQQQPSPVSVLDDFNKSPLSLRSYFSRKEMNGRVQPQQKQQWIKKLGEEEMNMHFLERISSEQVHMRKMESGLSSKAMIQSVDEVCRDNEWGQKREMGRIGLALQDIICRDMMEEIVTELGCCFLHKLHPRSCKRRLSF